MPALRSFVHSARLVAITVTGVIRLDDREDCFAGIMTPATPSYRKLVNMVANPMPPAWAT
jgi:hypothetical protein